MPRRHRDGSKCRIFRYPGVIKICWKSPQLLFIGNIKPGNPELSSRQLGFWGPHQCLGCHRADEAGSSNILHVPTSILDCVTFGKNPKPKPLKISSLFHCFIVSLFHCFTVSLFHCFTVSLFHCFIVSLFHYFIVSLFHCFIVSLFHCFIVSLFHCFTVSLFHCFIVSLFHCFTVSLFHCFHCFIASSSSQFVDLTSWFHVLVVQNRNTIPHCETFNMALLVSSPLRCRSFTTAKGRDTTCRVSALNAIGRDQNFEPKKTTNDPNTDVAPLGNKHLNKKIKKNGSKTFHIQQNQAVSTVSISD